LKLERPGEIMRTKVTTRLKRPSTLLAGLLMLSMGADRVLAFYNPNTGRWLSRDPIEEKGAKYLYGFVLNNPTGNWDPDGRIVTKSNGDPACEKACSDFAAGLSKDQLREGGTCVCKLGRKCPCIWEAGFIQPNACPDVDEFGLRHEKAHCGSRKAECDHCATSPVPLGPSPGLGQSELDAEECRLRKKELECLTAKLGSQQSPLCQEMLRQAINRTRESLEGCPP
jgi:hypothetical protein